MSPNLKAKLESNVALLYGSDASSILSAIGDLVNTHADSVVERRSHWDERDSLLITYGDSLGENNEPGLSSLEKFLLSRIKDHFTLLHVLPFYPWTDDDGFSVVDFREVNPPLGEWKHIRSLSGNYRVVFDGVFNHVSKASEYVQGHLAGDPDYLNFCINEERSFDDSRVTRPRTSPLFHSYQGNDGERRLWTTFSEDQVDLNLANPAVLLEILDVVLFYAAQGASMIRLDAVPYMWKASGTDCVHRPQTHAFIRIVRLVLDIAAPHVAILSETNVPHAENLTYFGDKGDEAQIIYNFTLAPLILYGLKTGDVEPLTRWAATLVAPGRRCTFLNVTSTHDGIGMRPTEGILTSEQQRVLTDLAVEHGGAVSTRSNPDGSQSPYELNITFFDAINNPNEENPDREMQVRRFLVSQAIPMALAGIPAIYIHCLLGSRNDRQGAENSGIKRRINREKLSLEQVTSELDDPDSLRSHVFGAIMLLLKERQSISAFHPAAANTVLDLGRHIFAVLRENRETGCRCLAIHNLSQSVTGCTVPEDFPLERARDIFDEKANLKPPYLLLPAYGIRWLIIDS
ncbi:MAG: sugar phosphorylase [Verrucomicrobiaceae bacterium]|nr:sugar phosphorylase [Verrucomicrobiaceae bacterium]